MITLLYGGTVILLTSTVKIIRTLITLPDDGTVNLLTSTVKIISDVLSHRGRGLSHCHLVNVHSQDNK